MYSAQGIFQHHFQCKKCTLYSIKYVFLNNHRFESSLVFASKARADQSGTKHSQILDSAENYFLRQNTLAYSATKKSFIVVVPWWRHTHSDWSYEVGSLSLVNVIKLFSSLLKLPANKWVFVPDQPLKPSLLFGSEVRDKRSSLFAWSVSNKGITLTLMFNDIDTNV